MYRIVQDAETMTCLDALALLAVLFLLSLIRYASKYGIDEALAWGIVCLGVCWLGLRWLLKQSKKG
jgi:hypothetical protein